MPTRELSAEERYEALVDRVTTPEECHLWKGAPSANGYGRFKVSPTKTVYAHRWGYERHIGPIPQGLVIRHSCDTRLCQNPAHLSVGTHADNIRDRDERGRGRWLQKAAHPQAKLTPEQVEEIRMRYQAGGITQADLGAEYGVTQANVSIILKKKTWV